VNSINMVQLQADSPLWRYLSHGDVIVIASLVVARPTRF